MSYKIKIGCTTKEELSFNNKKINKNQYDKIHSMLLQHSYFGCIDKTIVLHKKLQTKKMTTKSIELFCNTKIDEKEFLDFLRTFKKSNFKSEVNTSVDFIDTKTNEVLLHSKFNTEEIQKKSKKRNYKNNSSYFVEKIY